MTSSDHHSPLDLTERMLSGDVSSYDDIIAWYAKDIIRLSYLLLQDQEEARDVLQESLIRLVQHVRQGKFRANNGSIKGFLLVTARNLCLDRLKKRVKWTVFDESEDCVPLIFIEQSTPDRVSDRHRFQEALEEAIQYLTPQERTILVLHDLNGESNLSIASSLHLSTNAVTTHLCRARRKLRQRLYPFRNL